MSEYSWSALYFKPLTYFDEIHIKNVFWVINYLEKTRNDCDDAFCMLRLGFGIWENSLYSSFTKNKKMCPLYQINTGTVFLIRFSVLTTI